MIFYCFILGGLFVVPLVGRLRACTRGTVHEGKDCLPSTKPRLCYAPTWDLLQKKFDGKRCQDEPIIGIKNYNLGIL